MANKNGKHLLHVRSNQLIDGKPKLPTSTDLDYGEIAINYADGQEKISIKSSENIIRTVSTDDQNDAKFESKSHFKDVDEVVSKAFSVINKSCGLNKKMKYVPQNEIIDGASSLSEAIGIIADKIENLGDGLKIDSETGKISTKIGNGLQINNTVLECKIASSDTLGSVKVGDGLKIDSDSAILSTNIGDGLQISDGVLETKIAESDVLGSVMVGSGMTIDANTGKISPKIGNGLVINSEDGVLSANIGDGLEFSGTVLKSKTASSDTLGSVKVGDGLKIDSETSILSTNIGDGLKIGDNGVLETKIAESDVLGSVMVGSGMTIDASTGKISPKIGDGLKIDDSTGILSTNISDGLKIDDEGKISANIGDGLQISDGVLETKIAESDVLGSVMVGSGMTIDASTGKISPKIGDGLKIDDSTGILSTNIGDGLEFSGTVLKSKTASSDTLGSVKVGDGLKIDSETSILSTNIGDGLQISNGILESKVASSSELGSVKIGYTENGRNYPVELSNEQMFVNVPWTDTTYTLGSFGITATAAELNYCDGVTSNIQTQLNGKSSTAHTHTYSDVGALAATLKGAKNGVAELDSAGKVPASQLPSYVDDVLEYTNLSSFPTTGETGKIYIDKATNKTYRWSGTAYVVISETLALGTTSSTAYRGDLGNVAYQHSQVLSGNPHKVTKAEVGLGNVGNFKAVSTVASQGLTDQEKINARTNIGAGTSSFNGDYNSLSNKPTIGNGTITITQNGASKGTFTMNQTGNTTIALTDNNTTYSNATQSVSGLMSSSDKQKLDGIATNANKYVHPTTSGNKHIPSGGSAGQILRWASDGTAAWGSDNNTTYSQATASTLGLVKIGYAENGKNYPVELNSSGQMFVNVPWTDTNTTYGVVGANGTTGLVKNGSSVTSSAGYTACPIVGGVPYYKDTNTTYTLGSFGLTATAAELNYCDGVTSNIQTQLNGKAASSHTHTKAQITDFPTIGNGTITITQNGATKGSFTMNQTGNATIALTDTNTTYTFKTINGNTITGSGNIVIDSGVGKSVGDNAEIFNDYANNVASGSYSHAEGERTKAKGVDSHAEGLSSIANGSYSHAEGWFTFSNGSSSHSEGQSTSADGEASHAEGIATLASGSASHAEGDNTVASGKASHASGFGTQAVNYGSCAIGSWNYMPLVAADEYNSNAIVFSIGNGNGGQAFRGNAFAITYAGKASTNSSYSSPGADYAEMFEWKDGNVNKEDRVGYFVEIEGTKIKIANSNSKNLFGIVSATPIIIGNSPLMWQGREQRDEWGRVINAEQEITVKRYNSETKMEEEVIEKFYGPLINEEYDNEQEYIQRYDRHEWSAIGMFGQLLVRQDGTLSVGDYCKCNDDGIATKSDSGWYVMDIKSEKIALILFK